MTTQNPSVSLPQSASAKSWTTGLAIFSMFFGAGNLIFPLMIGKSVGENAWYAIAGLALTAVLMPFLGLISMVFFEGDCRKFFGVLGKIPGAALLLLLQMILGPFGVIPRLVTLMYAMAKPYLYSTSLTGFSIAVMIVIFLFSFQREKLIRYLGILTPFLILCLGVLVGLGLYSGEAVQANLSPKESFFEGLIGGYNTMDLIAAFMFATVILPHFQSELQAAIPANRGSLLLKKLLFSSAIAAPLLFATYVGLCFISSYHAKIVDPTLPSEEILSAIARQLLGPAGGWIAAMAVILACLTTALSLAAIFSEFLRKNICREKINPRLALLATLLITTLFANLGFQGIAAFLGPVLQILYPGLILLTFLNLMHALFGMKTVRWPVFATFGISSMLYVFG